MGKGGADAEGHPGLPRGPAGRDPRGGAALLRRPRLRGGDRHPPRGGHGPVAGGDLPPLPDQARPVPGRAGTRRRARGRPLGGRLGRRRPRRAGRRGPRLGHGRGRAVPPPPHRPQLPRPLGPPHHPGPRRPAGPGRPRTNRRPGRPRYPRRGRRPLHQRRRRRPPAPASHPRPGPPRRRGHRPGHRGAPQRRRYWLVRPAGPPYPLAHGRCDLRRTAPGRGLRPARPRPRRPGRVRGHGGRARRPQRPRHRLLHGDATDLPPLRVDLVTMTANVAQVFLTDVEWAATLRAAHAALRPGGRLVFETRDPAAKAWQEWTRERTYQRTVVPGVGAVQTWEDLLEVSGELVSFRSTNVFESDGAVLTSDSTLRFRQRDEVAASLVAAGYVVDEVRQAPDRPGRELVFVARRAG